MPFVRVVFVIEDSLPNGRVSAELTPTLWSLIAEGGWHPDGGVSVLASSTYPNHATFATGADVSGHRIFTNDIWDGEWFVCSSTVGPVGDTIFAAAKRAGRSTAAITGDTTMLGCMGAGVADVSWPSSDAVRDAAKDCLGYPANSAVLEALSTSGALDSDLLFVHMNDPDSTLHRFGPHADETTDSIRRVDDDLAAVVEMLRPCWDETVVFVVSDHEQEQVDPEQTPLDLADLISAAGQPGQAHNEGSVGIVYGSNGAHQLEKLPGIAGAVDLDVSADGTSIALAWSSPGRVFGSSPKTMLGQHGSPRTRTQVATVSGGHPVVPKLARRFRCGFGSADGRPHATYYAHVMAELLEIRLGL